MAERELRQQSETYTRAFQTFLTHTDEKRVLFEELNWRITRRIGSLLDVGAGNGDLAIPVSKLTDRYIAFEQKADYAERLRTAGLIVIEGVFPRPLPERFDLVLLSHSLPWKQEDYEPFVDSAWTFVKPGGRLFIITYNDEESEWNRLLGVCGLEAGRQQRYRLKKLTLKLQSFGPVATSVIRTYVRTRTLDMMMEALAFVHSDGDKEKFDEFRGHEEVRASLKARYHSKTGYAFPFDHIMLVVQK